MMSQMAAFVTGLVLLAFVVGYRFYARWIGEKIYEDGQEIQTPAHEFFDGQDFVPTRKSVLLGHHFTSIAGAAPIIGPCVAAYWGWLPALLWVVLGTIFMGAVHDFGALVISVREKGRSIADLTAKVVSNRVRVLFLSMIMVVSWLVLAVFAMAMAGLFVAVPTSVLPVNISILVAVVVGWMLYKRGVAPLIPSIVALLILYGFVWIGVDNPIDFTLAPEQGGLGWSKAEANHVWIVGLLIYAGGASVLPVWLLLQPRDYVNSHQLLINLGLLFAGLFLAAPEFDAPMLRMGDDSGPSMFPLLFVTVACGAISGFHGLVSSGTTSKQINRLADARLIGYGSMLGEGSLAIASMMAAVAGIGLVAACTLPGQGSVPDLHWAVYYDTWAHAQQNKATAFVLGGGAFLAQLGLSPIVSRTLIAVMVICFASTTLDTAARIERLIISELAESLRIKWLSNRYVATVVAIVPAIILATWDVTDKQSGTVTQAGWVLWPIFGASNQMIAALTLMVLALYFWQRRRPILPLLIPMVFIMAITLISLIVKVKEFWVSDNSLLLVLAMVLLAMMLWMSLEGLSLLFKNLIQSKNRE